MINAFGCGFLPKDTEMILISANCGTIRLSSWPMRTWTERSFHAAPDLVLPLYAELIFEDMLYIAMPPLYKAMPKAAGEYLLR